MEGSTTDELVGSIDDSPDLALPSREAALPPDPSLPGKPRQKLPPLPPQILQELRLAYVGNKRELSANLTRIVARSGIPRSRLKHEAWRRGWCSKTGRAWKPEELEYLTQNFGVVPVKQIARFLKRGAVSVQMKAAELNCAGRFAGGYSVPDLCQCFGLPRGRIEGWVRRGLLGKARGGAASGEVRSSEASLVRFIRLNPSEYDLTRLNQVWFKAMIFGSTAGVEEGERE